MSKKGDCYEISAKLILDDFWRDSRRLPNLSSSARLVHGMVKGQGALEGIRYGHGWVEDGSVVYDYSNGRELKLPKELFYAIGDIRDKDLYKYKKEEVRKWVLREETWGPWEANGGTERIRENAVTNHSEIGIPGIRVPRDILMSMKESLNSARNLVESNSNYQEIVQRILEQEQYPVSRSATYYHGTDDLDWVMKNGIVPRDTFNGFIYLTTDLSMTRGYKHVVEVDIPDFRSLYDWRDVWDEGDDKQYSKGNYVYAARSIPPKYLTVIT